jgi:hypothetical protein
VTPNRATARDHTDPLAPPSAGAVTVPAHFGRNATLLDAIRREGDITRRTASLRRLLWWAVWALVAINLLLALLLLLTQGRLPGIYEPGVILLPGVMG